MATSALCTTCIQAEIAKLLIDSGALVNGGAAANFARKSPLEEALAFSRSACCH
jgi:hypothetical protein